MILRYEPLSIKMEQISIWLYEYIIRAYLLWYMSHAHVLCSMHILETFMQNFDHIIKGVNIFRYV